MLNRDDIVAIGRSTIERAIAHPPQKAVDWSVRVTSGTTTGSPLVMFFKRDVERNTVPWFARRTVVCVGSLSSRLSTVLNAYQNRKSLPSSCLSVDHTDLNSTFVLCITAFAPEHFVGFPSFIAKVGEHMDTDTAAKVSSLMVSGELLTATLTSNLRERFPNARIIPMYASMELGYMSTLPCEHLGLNQYHIRDSFDIEIDSPDENGHGAILVSTTLNGDIPISQYKIGDTGRIISVPCKCGASQTLELFGRSGGDFVKLLGAIIRRDEFERTLSLLSAPPDDYRLEIASIQEDGVLRGTLIAKFYYRHRMPTDDLLKEMTRSISENFFITQTKTLAELVQSGVFKPLATRCTKEPFPTTLKDVKLVYRA